MRLIDADKLRDWVKAEANPYGAPKIDYDSGLKVLDMIDRMPTIEPENDWIPCNERMPEEHEWIGTKRFGTTISDEVYVTFETPDGQRFAKHISFQNGKLSSSDKRSMEVWYNDAKPIAWMPLSKAYKPKENDK